VDNRGMGNRGRAFAEFAYHDFGPVQLQDQLTMINQVLRQYPQLDAKRMGWWGWSWGGTFTLYAMTLSNRFFAGVCVAPVTNWRLYDTFYTERYLGRPQDNDAGYTRSSPLAWLDGLTAKLYLVHGMADDNVLFLNSTELMAELQKRGTQFQFMAYPGAKHGLNLPGQRTHVYHLIENFFQSQIKGAAPAVNTVKAPAPAPMPAPATTR
jgi:dipeptidyl-peptidase-4